MRAKKVVHGHTNERPSDNISVLVLLYFVQRVTARWLTTLDCLICLASMLPAWYHTAGSVPLWVWMQYTRKLSSCYPVEVRRGHSGVVSNRASTLTENMAWRTNSFFQSTSGDTILRPPFFLLSVVASFGTTAAFASNFRSVALPLCPRIPLAPHPLVACHHSLIYRIR